MKRVFILLAMVAMCTLSTRAQFVIEKTDATEVTVEGNVTFSDDAAAGIPFADIATIRRSGGFVITFEDCDLDGAHHNIVAGAEGVYRTRNIRFVNMSLASPAQFSGVAVSNRGEVSNWDSKYTSQCQNFNVITTDSKQPAGADGSAQFAVFYYHPTVATATDYLPEFKFAGTETHTIVSLDVNNIADIWQKCKIGFYSKPGFSEGDYYDLIFTGYDADGNATGSVTVPMADFRDGKEIIVNEWTTIDMSALGAINKLTLTYDASEAYHEAAYGIDTYGVCIDNIRFE